MTLEEFVKNYVERNTLCRLWFKGRCGIDDYQHIMVGDGVFMEHELLNKKIPQSNYLNYICLGVTDIVTDTAKEAVNLVIKREYDRTNDYINENICEFLDTTSQQSKEVLCNG